MNVGEARAVVLLGDQGTVIPVSLLIQAEHAREGCVFQAPCPLSEGVRDHVRDVVATLVRDFTQPHKGSKTGWRISASLPASALLYGQQISIDGHSADLAFAVAMASAILNRPVRTDLAMAGQLVPKSRKVEMVDGLESKLTLDDASVAEMLIPDWRGDRLFRRLRPQEFVSVRTEVKASARRIVEVRSLDEAFSYASQPPKKSPKPDEPEGKRKTTSRVPRCSAVTIQAREIVREVLLACSESALAREIDFPLEQRFASFAPRRQRVVNSRMFLGRLSALLSHLGFHKHSSVGRATEAVRLVDKAYGAEGGFEAALKAVRSGQDGGLRVVMSKVIDQIRKEQRENRVQAVLARLDCPLDGKARLQLTRALLRECPELTMAHPELAPNQQLAHRLESLVLEVVAFRHRIQRRFSP